MESINPSDGTTIGTIAPSTSDELRNKVASANAAKRDWKELGIKKRIELLKKVHAAFSSRKEDIAELASKEMGKPITESLEDIDGGLWYFQWYLDNSEICLQPEVTLEDDQSIHTVYFEPTGTVAAISPWNFPFPNFIWCVIPHLIVGNTVVFKHSEECFLSGKLYEEIVSSVGFPEGVFSEVYGDGSIGAQLVEQDIDMIAFTGSTKIGQELYQIAARKFIRVLLELGGSAPGIVFEDANIDDAIETIMFGRFYNCGQICDGMKRLIIHKNIAEEVIMKLKTAIQSKKVGNAEEKSTEIGPLVANRQVNLLQSQLQDALDKGAEIIVGGTAKDNFFDLTLVKNVTPEMRVWQEEVFGPLLPIVTFSTEDEAIKMANDTQYGLGAYVFTNDNQRLDRLSSAIEAGMINCNGTDYVQPCNPFGGYKRSGIGREHGKYGLRELCQIKVVAKPK